MNTIVYDFYNTIYNPDTGKVFPGYIPLLTSQKKSARLILISTGSMSRWSEITGCGLMDIFDQIILCKSKSPEIYVPFACKNTLIVGDRNEEEIRIARKLGCKTLIVNPSKQNPAVTVSLFFNI